MSTFSYRGFDAAGHAARGMIEASSAKEARERLTRSGIFPEHLGEGGRGRVVGRRAGGFGLAERAMVYEEMAAMLSAGLSVERALDVLLAAPELASIRSILADVRDRIRDGASLAVALAETGGDVPDYECAIVEVGESSGTLSRMFRELASFLEDQRALRDRVRNAMIYPTIVICVAILVAVGMLGFLVPWVSSLLLDTGRELPPLTRAMVVLGTWVKWGGIPLLGALVLAALVLARRTREDAALAVGLDRRMFRAPVAGRALSLLVNLRFAHTLAMLLDGGVPLVDGLPLAGRCTGNRWVAQLVEAQAKRVRHGTSLADALQDVPPLAVSLPGWVRAGEASGDLVGMLRSAASRYRRLWDAYVQRVLGLLEPAVVLLVGLFTALVALAILLPLLAVSRAIG